ncbi:hypothetical protein BJY04DRAFT_231251 [Aspergillus karnatakaensis]|uniref:uncharacterized protein n=1 Tax=Aspergillus karnatakaensis TaxID=1810916 RepID=UPI003CCD40C7
MLLIFRLRTLIRSPRAQAHLSIWCRGKKVSRDDLFRYTNSHFLIAEQYQYDRRYVKFDVDAPCNVAATAGKALSPVTSIEKMEGGFSKAFLMKRDDGSEVVAKIPCRIAGPARLRRLLRTPPSDLLTGTIVHKYTSVPVPRVLSWQSDNTNPMPKTKQLSLVRNLAKLEAQFSAIQFPAYGGIYLRADSWPLETGYHALDESVDSTGSFCIDATHGPWTSLSQLGISIIKREISRLSIKPIDGQPPPAFHTGTIEGKTRLLESTIPLMYLLDTHPVLPELSHPTLWHTDLHKGNVYVLPDGPSGISCLIDLQALHVMPAFMQAGWPEFTPCPEDYTKGHAAPKYPENFDSLDEEGKAAARRKREQAMLAKAYEIGTYLENQPVYKPLTMPRVFRELFRRSGEVAEIGVLALKPCLIEFYQSWSHMGFTEAWVFVWDTLRTDSEGKANEELLGFFIEAMVEDGKSAEEARSMWPFPPGA